MVFVVKEFAKVVHAMIIVVNLVTVFQDYTVVIPINVVLLTISMFPVKNLTTRHKYERNVPE